MESNNILLTEGVMMMSTDSFTVGVGAFNDLSLDPCERLALILAKDFTHSHRSGHKLETFRNSFTVRGEPHLEGVRRNGKSFVDVKFENLIIEHEAKRIVSLEVELDERNIDSRNTLVFKGEVFNNVSIVTVRMWTLDDSRFQTFISILTLVFKYLASGNRKHLKFKSIPLTNFSRHKHNIKRITIQHKRNILSNINTLDNFTINLKQHNITTNHILTIKHNLQLSNITITK
mmetsp:Transcript_35121/g.39862  ORF Transcript_35121/g.39862 Transcript_35121/m.39862 type:complete len:232 (+) Transcript_35121:478-1173(+)